MTRSAQSSCQSTISRTSSEIADPNRVEFKIGESGKKKRAKASKGGSKAAEDGMARYTGRTALREMIDTKTVLLLKASWLAAQGFRRHSPPPPSPSLRHERLIRLRLLKRLDCLVRRRAPLPPRAHLEQAEPEAYADPSMTERCLKEVCSDPRALTET